MMQIGFVGLGKMGLNMVTRLAGEGHQIVAYDRSADALGRAQAAGSGGAASLEAPVAALGDLLSPDDVVIDGGNTNFHDDVRRAQTLSARGIHYVDAGTSGGVWGLEEGYCLMVGGDAEVCRRLEPIFLTLAPRNGYLRVG